MYDRGASPGGEKRHQSPGNCGAENGGDSEEKGECMKKALVFSDSHGMLENLLAVLKRHPDTEAVFHMGDIGGDADRLRRATPYPVYIVRGNCDYGPDLPVQIVTEFGGKKIGLCHGHRYLNYGGIDAFRYWALEQNVDIAMFGHTHVPFLDREGRPVLLNPGSISRPRQERKIPTYTVLTIREDGEAEFAMCEFKK